MWTHHLVLPNISNYWNLQLFFSTCFMFHSLGAIVTLPSYPDPVYFWRGSLSDLCTLHLARGHFFVLFCYFAFLFTLTFNVNTCVSFLGILSTTVKLLVSKILSRLEWNFFENPFGKTSIPIGGRQQSHSISINIGCVTQFLTSRNFWKCTNFTNFPPHLYSALSWPSQTVNYMMGRGLIFKPLNNDFRCPIWNHIFT